MVTFNTNRVAAILAACDVVNVDHYVEQALLHSSGFDHSWSDATVATWAKLQAEKDGSLQAVKWDHDEDSAVTAVLHVFPLNYTETPEGLERIRRDAATLKSQVARSKVSKTNEVIHAIDRVAARVAQDKE